jgi:uracil-DNA glycosylase family 4
MDRAEFNSIVDGLVNRLELMRAYGVLDAPVAPRRLVVTSRTDGAGGAGSEGASGASGEGGGAGGGPRAAFVSHEPFSVAETELVEKIIKAMELAPELVTVLTVARTAGETGVAGGAPAGDAANKDFAPEIAGIAPRVIVTFGEEAARMVVGKDVPLGVLRGRFHRFAGVLVMPTHHPAELLLDPALKREAWDDIKKVMGELKGRS